MNQATTTNKYIVNTVHRDTGKESVIEIEAKNEDDAAKLAGQRTGQLIASVVVGQLPKIIPKSPADVAFEKDQNNLTKRENLWCLNYKIIAGLCFSISIISFVSHYVQYSDLIKKIKVQEAMAEDSRINRILSDERFKSDNALGATANALEKLNSKIDSQNNNYLVEQILSVSIIIAQAMYGLVFLVVGVLFLILANTIKLRATTRSIIRSPDLHK